MDIKEIKKRVHEELHFKKDYNILHIGTFKTLTF